ncbi:ribosomal L7Ae/L30e/S12e/Gadd45 family protein [Myxococcaceae bacterium GXIMD 01537]
MNPGGSTQGRAEQLIREAASAGGVARGVLEVVRAVEQGRASAVFLASDVDRPELAAQVRALCEARRVPLVQRHARVQLGDWSGIERPAAVVAVLEVAHPERLVQELASEVPALARSLAGLQRLARHLEPSPARGPLVDAVHSAADALGAPRVEDPERALATLLRATVLLAVEQGVDLERLTDRWSLERWLRDGEEG